jgi:peptide/nickel transport system permease protein
MSEAELRARKWDNAKLSLSVFYANKAAVVGLVIVMIYVVIAVIDQAYPQLIGITNAGTLVPNFSNVAALPPSFTHPFGTEPQFGYDIFTSMIKAIRIDLFYSVLVVAIGAALGSIIGVISATVGGMMDEIVMRITDVFFSIPYLVLALAVGFILGRSLLNMSIALAIVWWPLYARYTRSQTLSTKEYTFVEAAKASGVRRLKIMYKHILPNTLPPVFIQISLDLGSIMVIFSTLAFIGFISNATVPELGFLTSLGLGYVQTAPWAVVFPGVAITLFALAVNLMGDGLRDVIDPRRRS